MLRHIKEGGNPYDDLGSHIISLSEEFAQLQKFRNYAKKNSLVSEDTADVVEGVSDRLSKIKKEFKSLSGTKGYKVYSENFESKAVSLEEEGVDDLRDKFTVRSFDENVAEALPHVARVVKEIATDKDRVARLRNLIDKVTQGSGITLRKPLDPNDPDNPENKRFANDVAKLAAFSGYLSNYVMDDEVSNMLSQLGVDIHDMKPQEQLTAAKLLTYMRKSAKVKNPKESSADAGHKAVQQIEECFSKYEPEKFLL
jgi:hypothetical protein